jgi:dienelactone hydrolase
MTYKHLGPVSDLVDATRESLRQPPPENELLRHLAFTPWKPEPREPRIEKTWIAGDILAEEISWSCGYGPRTHAWLYRLEKNASAPGPALVLLHDHSAFKFWGKEKVADGPEGAAPGIEGLRHQEYGDRAIATELARAGFTVLVHDAFLWGSRRIPYETMPASDRHTGELLFRDQCRTEGEAWYALPEEVRLYNAAAKINEHLMSKYAIMLGTTLAGIINFEDRVALEYLNSRTDVCNGWIGSIGLSIGGLRSSLLRGTSSNDIKASVVVALMSTYAGLLDQHVVMHTWILYPPSLARAGDWPDVIARHFDVPVLLQYDLDDELFSRVGMEDADRHIRAAFDRSPHPGNYKAEFYPGHHKFDVPMQAAAIDWLQARARDTK